MIALCRVSELLLSFHTVKIFLRSRGHLSHHLCHFCLCLCYSSEKSTNHSLTETNLPACDLTLTAFAVKFREEHRCVLHVYAVFESDGQK